MTTSADVELYFTQLYNQSLMMNDLHMALSPIEKKFFCFDQVPQDGAWQWRL
ncbi:MAG: hypothetical protein J5803_00245 [Desulfovibrio sp.]|nr:hypothetical protein [Desulfovibrio sp.]